MGGSYLARSIWKKKNHRGCPQLELFRRNKESKPVRNGNMGGVAAVFICNDCREVKRGRRRRNTEGVHN